MTRRTIVIIGAVMLSAGVLAGALTFATRGSLRSYLDSTFTRVSTDASARSSEYSADGAPSKVAAQIADKWKPAERVNDPSGYFLRYRNDIVAVTVDEDGGSRIYVDDADRGYTRWYGYLGGRWGTYSGPGDTFRGGGPGAGK